MLLQNIDMFKNFRFIIFKKENCWYEIALHEKLKLTDSQYKLSSFYHSAFIFLLHKVLL